MSGLSVETIMLICTACFVAIFIHLIYNLYLLRKEMRELEKSYEDDLKKR